ncbi:myb-related transcription factor, partner of profilin-like [Astyanax mexicanus]|uniref:Myb-related transcription factor, partner of profilin-like n=1 Tax=Astyanax mexicanus TaxID=7994 RepID=A0A8T2LBZ8_ASTMX|nr:myb-related transcription factor, partner of profilin-like [Astyanax mexicanus]
MKFFSLAKKRGAELRRERSKTGGGQLLTVPLTSEEERVLAILGPTVTEGISGGVDVCLNEFPSTSPQPASPVLPSPCSSTASSAGPSHKGPSLTGPCARPRSERNKRPSACGCIEELIALEKERLQTDKDQVQLKREELQLRREEVQQRERHHQELQSIKKSKLQILAKQLELAEAQFSRPSISVPIFFPSAQDPSTTDEPPDV